jgi:hypothetical protein
MSHVLFSQFLTAKRITIWAFIGILLWAVPDAVAFQLSLAWDKSSETNVTGYKLFYGLASGQYTSNVDVGNQTSCTVSNLTDGKTYYFAVTAYNSYGQSPYSNEVIYVSSTTSTNHAPVAQNGTLSIKEDNTGTGTLSATDADGNTLLYSIVTQPAHGTITLDSYTGRFTYSPSSNYNGSDSFTFKAQDNLLSSNTATVSITISSVNDAPVASNDSAQTIVNQSVTISVLSNDTDADGDTLSLTSVTSGAIGTTTRSGTAVVYSPTGYTGTDTFTYTVSDLKGGSATGTVTVKVSASTSGNPTIGDVVMAINAGGSQYAGSDGTVYQADAYYSGGSTRSTTNAIGGTTDDKVYQSYRYGTFSYSIPVTNDSYSLTLKLAELSYSSAGQRVFNIYVEGQSVATNVDVFSAVGQYQAYDIKIPVTVTDGYLNITFGAVTTGGRPMLSGLLLQKDSDLLPQNGWSLKYVDSQELVGEDGAAENAFDNDPNTFWHTEWYQADPTYPHEIQINLGGLYSINGFRYLPRQDGYTNGRIKQYQFYISTDGTNWGTAVATGTFANDGSEKEVTFTAKSGRYIRLKALDEVNGKPWASIAEIRLLGQ